MCMHTENALARACDRGGNRHGGGYRRGQAMQAGVHILMKLPDAQERHLKKLGKIQASVPVCQFQFCSARLNSSAVACLRNQAAFGAA